MLKRFTVATLILCVGCNLFGPSSPLVNPADDSALFRCHLLANVDYGFNKDAGGAYAGYTKCVTDAGLR